MFALQRLITTLFHHQSYILVIKFYLSKLNIFCIQQQGPQFNIAPLDHNKYYNCNIESLTTTTVSPKTLKVDWITGICHVKNFKLPDAFLSKYKQQLNHMNSYDIIFIVGEEGTN